jgi:hypothetical protein
MSLRQSTCRVVLGLALALVGQAAAWAAGFLDDFEDNNVTDGNPVTWVADLGGSGLFPGTYQASGGNYNLIDPTGDFNQMITFVNGQSFGDVHIRTQGKVVPNPADPELMNEGNLSILARLDPTTLSGYAFYFDTDFNLGVIILENGAAVEDESFDFDEMAGNFDGDDDVDGNDFLIWQQEVGGPGSADADGSGTVDAADLAIWQADFGKVRLSPLTEVVFEASVVGQVLSARVWPVGQPRPDEPQFTYTNDDPLLPKFTAGVIGLGYDDDGVDTTGLYRFFEAKDMPFVDGGVSAVPEPAGLALLVAALTSAGVLRKRSPAAR